jgi:hypothetical protein
MHHDNNRCKARHWINRWSFATNQKIKETGRDREKEEEKRGEKGENRKRKEDEIGRER